MQTVAGHSLLHGRSVTVLQRRRTVSAPFGITAAQRRRNDESEPEPQTQQRMLVHRLLAPATVAAVLLVHPPAVQAADLDAGRSAPGAAAEASKFEPQFNPGLLAVALFAAVSKPAL